MESIAKEKESEMSYASSDNSSKSSKAAKVDEEILRMGTDPVKSLIPQNYLIHFISAILPQITRCIEFALVVKFAGLTAMQYQITIQPFYELLGQNITLALASSANIFVQRNISKNQIVAANIYLAHFFLLAFIWCIINFSLYMVVVSSMFDNEIVGSYTLMRNGIGAFTCLFSISCVPFIKGENRYFVSMVRDLVE